MENEIYCGECGKNITNELKFKTPHYSCLCRDCYNGLPKEVTTLAAEKNFENRIKKYLEQCGYWHVKFFANAYTKSGVPDILACVNGYFVGIEVKAPNGRVSELQKYNIRNINNSTNNGIAFVLFPDQYDQFIRIVDFLREHKYEMACRIAKTLNNRVGI